MIRTLLLNLWRLIAAVVLLLLGICAVEVGFRVHTLRSRLQLADAQTRSTQELTEPSRTVFMDVRPLLDFEVEAGEVRGERLRIRTNEWGLRGPAATVPKPRGVYRILCLGSEDTFAPDLPEQATYPVRLQARLQSSSTLAIEVLNGGCPSAGPLVHQLRTRLLLGLQPDLILLQVSPRDVERDAPVRSVLRLDEEGRPNSASHPLLRVSCSLMDDVCREFQSANWLVETAGRRILSVDSGPQEFGVRPANQPMPVTQFDRRLLELPFVESARLAQGVYAQFLVVVCPTPWDLAASSQSPESPSAVHWKMLQLLPTDHKISLYDMIPEFQSRRDVRQLYSHETGLLSESGQAFVADRLAAYIVQHVSGIWTEESMTGNSVRPAPPIDFEP